MTRWFRHYAGMVRDDKLVRAALDCDQPVERVVWVFAAMLEDAAEREDDGRFVFSPKEAARFLLCDLDAVERIYAALEAQGRIKASCIVNWSKRQFASDRSRDRMRAHRERHSDRHRDVTVTGSDGGGDVTVTRQRQSQSKRDSTDPESLPPSSTSAHSQSERAEPAKPASRKKAKRQVTEDDLAQKFALFWEAYPIKVAKQDAVKAFAKAARDTSVTFAEIMAGLERYKAWLARQQDPHPAHASTWLNGQRWTDDLGAPKLSPAAKTLQAARDAKLIPAVDPETAQRMAAMRAEHERRMKLQDEYIEREQEAWKARLQADELERAKKRRAEIEHEISCAETVLETMPDSDVAKKFMADLKAELAALPPEPTSH